MITIGKSIFGSGFLTEFLFPGKNQAYSRLLRIKIFINQKHKSFKKFFDPLKRFSKKRILTKNHQKRFCPRNFRKTGYRKCL